MIANVRNVTGSVTLGYMGTKYWFRNQSTGQWQTLPHSGNPTYSIDDYDYIVEISTRVFLEFTNIVNSN